MNNNLARYPNGLPGLTPAEFFDEDEASQSLAQAGQVVEFVRGKLKVLEEGN